MAVRMARARIEEIDGGEGALDGVAEARDPKPLIGERLQHAHRGDQLGGIRRGVGERILRKP